MNEFVEGRHQEIGARLRINRRQEFREFFVQVKGRPCGLLEIVETGDHTGLDCLLNVRLEAQFEIRVEDSVAHARSL